MAFSLGYRERIILIPTDVTFTSVTTNSAGAITAVAGDIKVGGLGVGNSAIKGDNVTYSSGARSREVKFATTTFDLSDLTAGSIYNVIVYFSTTRYQSEFAVDYIDFNRPITLQVRASATVDATNNAFINVLNTLNRRHTGNAPFTAELVTDPGAGTDNVVQLTSVILGGSFRRVTTRLAHSNATSQGGLFESDDIATSIVGSEGRGTGKFVEENHRMATPTNRDPYRYGSDQIFDLSHGFSEFNFTQTMTDDREINTSIAGGVTSRQHKTTILVDEGVAPGQTLTAVHTVSLAAASYTPDTLAKLVDTFSYFISGKSGTLVGKDDDTIIAASAFLS